jgi:hypothetical protein
MSKLSLAVKRFIMDLPRPSKTVNIRKLIKRQEKIESFAIREATEADIPALEPSRFGHTETCQEK